MQLIKISTITSFITLNKGDTILVKWSDYFIKHTPGTKKLMLYTVCKNNSESNEIICDEKENHYFNWKLYLGLDSQGINKSNAEEVYLLTEENGGEF